MSSSALSGADAGLPDWVPAAAQMYLAHTEAGLPIRALARAAGCHASTILRQIRRVETRRDDPLVDAALKSLGAAHFVPRSEAGHANQKDQSRMSFQDRITAPTPAEDQPPSEATLMAEGARVLRRLCETGAVLAVAAEMEKAVIVRDGAGGQATRTGVVTRQIAEAMALKDWITAQTTGKITRYTITPAGRAALESMLDEEGATTPGGFSDVQADFAGQHRIWGEKTLPDTDSGRPRRMRYNLAESPLTALARRRDKNGEPFLTDALVTVGERLREDFELAQMGPRVTQNWDRFLTSGGRGDFVPDSGVGDGPSTARRRVADALSDLGPGLSDVALRCCCYLEGLETAEKKLGWSARSGKIVLRIALMRLKRHYDETVGPGGPLIG
ncbi:helix-turn-helix domain-containing protein [Roseobacter sinensis]|uniref:Helix-turn-helix domain-containing protein n=1 Tax=Roseobacter sinensis TaxID=2931391 RepID=A0ABT3BBH9_9RHOB|nr:helix-turn-helix domain-containing protein [Roseobacter sp. WL0113]MCV3270937.1 helix-turn-helix domain-containing protein [Roseobacter sp. WL0113]